MDEDLPRQHSKFAKRVRELPPPPRELSGTGGWIPRERKIIAPVFRSSELRYLPKKVQNAIESARIEADRAFRDETADVTVSDQKVSELRKKWVFTIDGGFIQAACEEISQGRGLAQVVHWRDDLFDDAAKSAGIEFFRDAVRDELRRSEEWGEGERLLHHAAKVAKEHENQAAGLVPGTTPSGTTVAKLNDSKSAPSNRGRKADDSTYQKMAEIVAEFEDWKADLDNVFEAFDKAEIPIPPRWGDRGYKHWTDCCENKIAIRVIEYRLSKVTKN
jgi:hypothetical protein